jgi:hypothetical protein
MVRRVTIPFALAGLVLAASAGCEGWRQGIRTSETGHSGARNPLLGGHEATAVEADPSKIMAVDADAKNPRPFFKSNRRAGTWSSEAREVESHFGIGP